MEETKWRTSKTSVKEGFDIFGDDYFINVKRKLPVKGVGDIMSAILNYLKKLGSPVKQLDKGLEDFIQRLMVMMMGTVNCNTGKLSNTDFLNKATNDFTWANGQLNLLKNDTINTSYTAKSGAEDTLKQIESFSTLETPDLLTTINSFMTNHPNIKNKTALTTYYIQQLNAYESSIGAHPTSDELFVFNNEFDNALSSNESFNEVEKIASSFPKPSYENTQKGYKLYLKQKARFSITSDESISYFPFKNEYFPAPTDIATFESILKNKDDPEFVQKINLYLSSLNTPTELPTPASPPISPDPNYAFSVDIKTTKTNTIPEYLSYISQWYAFIIYKKQGQLSSNSYASIQSIVCAIYIQYLNAVEFQKYRVYSIFMTPYEIALFNHMFFIYLQQDTSISTVYNLSIEDGSNNWQLTTPATPNVYVNTVPLSIYQLVVSFVIEINTRMPLFTELEIQPLPMDVTLIIPALPVNQVIPPIYVLLCDYILENYTPIEIDGKPYPLPIEVSLDIKERFVPEGMSACELANQSILREAKSYAKTIKNELYRMLTIPIILYLVYNFYYLFFFKDCFSDVIKTDEQGKVYYEHTCETDTKNNKNGCFTPIFPDWEASFHSLENHKLDYIFEFIFKPVKFFYTFFNAFKAIFRKSIFGIVLKDELPYVFFLGSFVFIYRHINKYGKMILGMLSGLMQFKIPDIKIMGQTALKTFAKSITMICFFLSFMKGFFGFSFGEQINNLFEMAEKTESSGKGVFSKMSGMFSKKSKGDEFDEEEFGLKGGATKSATEESTQTWLQWLAIPTGALLFVVKCICAIIYWILKFGISLGMVTFSTLIFFVYFLYNLVFGMSSYTTQYQGTDSKIDLMFRIMYTKLCDTDKDGTVKYAAKSIFFFCIYFLTELVVLHKLFTGMNSFAKMKKPYTMNRGLTPNVDDDINKNNLAVKSFMVIIYGILMGFVMLWCIYKFQFRMPDMISAFKNRTEPDDTKDKRMQYECSGTDDYENASSNSFFKTFMVSDPMNKIFYEQLKAKMSGTKKPSMFEGFVSKITEYSEKITNGINSTVTNARNLYADYKMNQLDKPVVAEQRNEGAAF